jgi:FAD-linked sulfhydryl oxidase
MGHGCEDSICIDKPDLSKLSQSMQASGLYKQTEEEKLYPERPLYRTEFGRITWKVMHRIASIYPENPNDQEKELMSNTFNGLAAHFPCRECADHFKNEISINPPKIENNKTLSEWVCFQHNQVNMRLGKNLFDCKDIDKLIYQYKL